jgi:hypothetical protein
MTEVREITLRSLTRDNIARIVSVMPSEKYSFSGSALKLANGSTAIDLPVAACGTDR